MWICLPSDFCSPPLTACVSSVVCYSTCVCMLNCFCVMEDNCLPVMSATSDSLAQKISLNKDNSKHSQFEAANDINMLSVGENHVTTRMTITFGQNTLIKIFPEKNQYSYFRLAVQLFLCLNTVNSLCSSLVICVQLLLCLSCKYSYICVLVQLPLCFKAIIFMF